MTTTLYSIAYPAANGTNVEVHPNILDFLRRFCVPVVGQRTESDVIPISSRDYYRMISYFLTGNFGDPFVFCTYHAESEEISVQGHRVE